MTGFERKTGFAMRTGALEGTHIPIILPVSYPTTIEKDGIVFVIKDTYRFFDFNVGWPGKCHNSYVFKCFCALEDGTFFPSSQQEHPTG